MRALNEGDPSIRRSCAQPTRRSSRIDWRGRASRSAPASLWPRSRPPRSCLSARGGAHRSADRRYATWRPWAAICSRRAPYGDFAVALLALDATVGLQGGYGARDMPIEEFFAIARAPRGALVLAVSFSGPRSADAFRFRKVARVKPKGVSVISIAAWLPTTAAAFRGRASPTARWRRRRYGRAPPSARWRAVRWMQAGDRAAARGRNRRRTPADDALASAWYRREVAAGPSAPPAARPKQA